jgi:hypothetical protein
LTPFPIRESSREQQLREQTGLTEIREFDARALQSVLEADMGEQLTHKPYRTENLKQLLAAGTPIDAYPRVSANPWNDNKLQVEDGRHRIALAAELGQSIQIATTKEIAQAIEYKLKK